MSVRESIRAANGKFCINHPWRRAYAVCNVCELPYCFVDIMQDQDKLYCLNDIGLALEETNTQPNPSMNFFSSVSSMIFIANSLVLGYFTYPQAKFLESGVLAQGISTKIITYLLTINSAYYLPLGNIIIAILGVVAAITVMRKSIYGFGFSLLVSFAGLLLVLYEYLNSSVPYLFVSSALLMVCLSTLVYSRMSSTKVVTEEKELTPDIDWPKPETF